MNRKAFGTLILIACIFVVLAIVGQGRVGSGSIAGDTAGSLLLPELADNLDAVTRIEVTGAGRQALVSLERGNDEWTVTDAGGYSAERSKVNALLIALAEARIVEEKTANPELHSRLGVEAVDDIDAAGIEVALVVANGSRYEILLGDSYSGGEVYARLADSNQSVLVDRNPDVARDPSDWVVTEILDIASDRVQRVEITHADGEQLVISKEMRGGGNFTVEGIPDGRELQYAGIANVTANLLQGLQLEAVGAAGDGPVDAAVISEYWMFDGLVVTVTTSGADDDRWLRFEARFDVDQSLAFADLADDSDAAVASTRSEPDELNARLAGWRYQIPSYQMSQLTRRIEDLLRPQTDE